MEGTGKGTRGTLSADVLAFLFILIFLFVACGNFEGVFFQIHVDIFLLEAWKLRFQRIPVFILDDIRLHGICL